MRFTLTLGEFRQATKELTDDAEIFLDEGDLEFHEAILYGTLPAVQVLGHPAVVWLQMGQVWNDERDIDARIDAHQEV